MSTERTEGPDSTALIADPAGEASGRWQEVVAACDLRVGAAIVLLTGSAVLFALEGRDWTLPVAAVLMALGLFVLLQVIHTIAYLGARQALRDRAVVLAAAEQRLSRTDRTAHDQDERPDLDAQARADEA